MEREVASLRQKLESMEKVGWQSGYWRNPANASVLPGGGRALAFHGLPGDGRASAFHGLPGDGRASASHGLPGLQRNKDYLES